MIVTMKITRNGEAIFGGIMKFDTEWEANTWCTSQITDLFGDDLDKVRVRQTNETVKFNSKLDVVEQHQKSDYTTTDGVDYMVMTELLEES